MDLRRLLKRLQEEERQRSYHVIRRGEEKNL